MNAFARELAPFEVPRIRSVLHQYSRHLAVTSTPQAARRREAEEAAQLECCTFVPEMSLTAAAKRDREARMGSQGQRSHGPTLSSKFEVRH